MSTESKELKSQFINDIKQMMRETGHVTQYIGSRYVPLIAEPFEWSSEREYEPLTIVENQGNSFTSKQFVPKGVQINNTKYWAATGNFNAQIEQYRKEVAAFDGRITENTNNIATKAPISHAESTGKYGKGSASNFGHVKVMDTGSSAAADGVAASPKMVSTSLANYYTKSESDEKYSPKLVSGDGDILGCIGDSIGAGWSNEHPDKIPAWDKYLGDALNFASSNVFKNANGGAGFNSGTTFTEQVSALKTAITSAGKNVNDVKMIVIGGGINDVINKQTIASVKSGATSAVNAAAAAFPNAVIHVFPILTGYTGMCSLLLDLEGAVVEGVQLCNTPYQKRAVVHTGCWSWNYDGNDAGVSKDGIHLLEGGLKRVGTSMAIEINGGSAYREAFSFDITNAQGVKVATGHRRGPCVFFKLATNITTIISDGKNAALGLHPRYCCNDLCIMFSNSSEQDNIIMFGESKKGFFNSYKALSNKGCYGSVAYQIENPK